MLPPHWEIEAIQWGDAAFGITIVLWILQYTFTYPWWTDAIGRTLIFKDLCLLALVVPSVMRVLWPHLISLQVMANIDLGVITGIIVAMCWRIAVWYRIKPPSLDLLRRMRRRRGRES